MERLEDRISNWVLGTSILVAIYMVAVASSLDWMQRLALFIGMVFPLVLIRMVIVTLKSDYTLEDTFEDRFYEDGSTRSGKEQ